MKTLRYLMLALVATLFVVSCGKDPVERPTVDDFEINIEEGKNYPLVSSIPEIISPNTTETIAIILNGKGTVIENFAGEMYAHTGVLTDKSNSTSAWRYTKTNWGQNTPETKLENLGNNLWALVIKGGPRAYYGVPAEEKIKALAFVFRSADSKKEVSE